MICKNILTSYQLENYNNQRFLKFIYTHPKFWIFSGDRQKLVWTKKAILLAILTIILAFLDVSWTLYLSNLYTNISAIFLIVIIAILSLPIYMDIVNFLLSPIDLYLKNKIISQAKNKLKSFQNLKVIWVTWSYWKTSEKEILETILKQKFKVLCSSGNKNTPLWVSEVILNELDETYDVFIVEMWAYYPWDIKELCDLVNPYIWILTWITIQHLERFWNLENIINTKFELIESLKSDWLAVLDISNENVLKWLNERKEKLDVKNIIEIENPKNINYLQDLAWISFEYNWKLIETKLLASHSAKQISMAYEVAKYLWMNEEDITNWISKINYIEHRLELIYNPNTNVYIIDDSFNWNLEWVKSTANLLEDIKWHKRIYLTPGLVELWDKSDEIHLEIWKLLSKVIDKALLIDNKATIKIYDWLMASGFGKENITIYKTTLDAHNDLKNVLRSSDVIVFQNDWTDNYF